MTEKTCASCRWCNQSDIHPECYNPANDYPVGVKRTSCYLNRHNPMLCGSTAKHWEARPPRSPRWYDGLLKLVGCNLD